ncbi:hypothetical protein BDV96DRAFT_636607 [Lophiotrema nucula]|uniref:Mid2 domain-containing protein n=1 Tax=Lophiotrema nucula TaxID=690887 RepID=A0A6A5YPH2_9PLEO|nr:hypothetical protein BDV96DRAFT_636607 [Lophiotrema nucula]
MILTCKMLLIGTSFMLALYCAGVAAQTERESIGSFINPGPQLSKQPPLSQNPVWKLGSVQNIRWNFTNPIQAYSMDVIPINVTGKTPTIAGQFGIYTKYSSEQEKGDFDWVVTSDSYDVATYPVFMIEMTTAQDDKGISYSFNSEFFNISDAGPSSATTVSTVTQMISTASLVTTTSSLLSDPSPTSGTAVPAFSSTPKAASNAQETDNNNLPIALGVGLGVGIPIVLALAAMGALTLVRRRRSNTDGQAPSPTDGLVEKDGDDYKPPVELPLVAEKQPMELSSDAEPRDPQELPAYERTKNKVEPQELPT